jgi:hypothetical protein
MVERAKYFMCSVTKILMINKQNYRCNNGFSLRLFTKYLVIFVVDWVYTVYI